MGLQRTRAIKLKAPTAGTTARALSAASVPSNVVRRRAAGAAARSTLALNYLG